MNHDELRELQQIELAILLDVDRFCKEHHIPYFLGEGTLLGAIRHGGFIPWDDDVDILMMRADYERFLSLAQKGLAPGYQIQNFSTTDAFWCTFSKVRLVEQNSKFIESILIDGTESMNPLIDMGPFIDIFPIEYLPKKTGVLQVLQHFSISIAGRLIPYKLNAFAPRTLKQRVAKLISRGLKLKWIHKWVQFLLTLFGPQKRPYAGALTTFHPYCCKVVPSEVYEKQIFVPFEGHMLPVPVGYDRLLTTIYGDYSTLPPPEERISKHFKVV